MPRINETISRYLEWRERNKARWERFSREKPLTKNVLLATTFLGPLVLLAGLWILMAQGSGYSKYTLCTLGAFDDDPEMSRLNRQINDLQEEMAHLEAQGRPMDGTMLSAAMRLRFEAANREIDHLEKQRVEICKQRYGGPNAGQRP